jgi:hypothetical protein
LVVNRVSGLIIMIFGLYLILNSIWSVKNHSLTWLLSFFSGLIWRTFVLNPQKPEIWTRPH